MKYSGGNIKDAIRELILEAAAEISGAGEQPAPRAAEQKSAGTGPRVLIVYHTGLERVETAFEQVALIEAAAGKASFFQGPEARALLCSDDVKQATGARCSLNAASAEGLGRVLDHVEVVVLASLSLKVAARVAHLSLDCQGSELVAQALTKGLAVIAAEDGFIKPGAKPAPGLQAEVEALKAKLSGFGITFCPTARLAQTYRALSGKGGQSGAAKKVSDSGGALKLITGKDIITAATSGRTQVRLAPGGLVSPLARDMAKEYSVEIVEEF